MDPRAGVVALQLSMRLRSGLLFRLNIYWRMPIEPFHRVNPLERSPSGSEIAACGPRAPRRDLVGRTGGSARRPASKLGWVFTAAAIGRGRYPKQTLVTRFR